MPVIRISKDHYKLLKARAEAEDRPLSRVITKVLTEALGPRPNPQLKEKKVPIFYKDIVKEYFDHYEKVNGLKPDFGGKEAMHTKQIIKKLEKLNTKDGNIVDFFRVILNNLPEFYKTKNISIINGNFTDIIADIKNRRNKGSKLHQDGGIYDHRN